MDLAMHDASWGDLLVTHWDDTCEDDAHIPWRRVRVSRLTYAAFWVARWAFFTMQERLERRLKGVSA
jgi:hypothetical protein